MGREGDEGEVRRADGHGHGGGRAFSAFDRDVLKIGGSPLLCDLYSTFERYHDLTFFTEQCPCFYDFFPRGSVPFAGVIMDIMKDCLLYTSRCV